MTGLKSLARTASDCLLVGQMIHQLDRPHRVRINEIRYCADKVVDRPKVSACKHVFEHPPLDLDRVELRGVWRKVDQPDLPTGGLDKLVYRLVPVVGRIVQQYDEPSVFLAQLLEGSHERFRVGAFDGLYVDPVLARCPEQLDCLGPTGMQTEIGSSTT